MTFFYIVSTEHLMQCTKRVPLKTLTQRDPEMNMPLFASGLVFTKVF